MRALTLVSLAAVILLTGQLFAAESVPPGPRAEIAGDWKIKVELPPSGTQPGLSQVLEVAPPALVSVKGEQYGSLPIFDPKLSGWRKGAALRGVKAQECTTPGLLVPASLEVRAAADPSSQHFEINKDYACEPLWGTIGRIAGGRIGEKQPVFISYSHGLLRLDSVVLTAEGKLVYRNGDGQAAAPVPPALERGERRLINVWIPGRIEKLLPDHLFPVLEQAYPEPPAQSPSIAEKLVQKTMEKLRGGKPLRILAWGDSVTVGQFVPDPERNRWQNQFVDRLRQRFPGSKIELVTEAWGGRNTSSYLAEPPGSIHNYQEKVLGAKPDLVVSEFVNDAGLKPEQVQQRYGKLLEDFKQIGAEWIILTPHYVRPDWMGLKSEREIDEDPRPYVKGLREFATKNHVALAEGSLRYGRLWRQGIPYSSLMLNSINHPDARGMALFADALMALFPQK